jgi:phosphatidylglycerophosphate synthase
MLAALDKKWGLKKKFIEPIAPRIDPNLVSSAGFLTGPLAGYFLWKGNLALGTVFIFLNALSDLFDGVIARKYGKVSKRGSLLDDLADRTSDVSIALGLGGLAGQPLIGAFCAILLVLNSYLSLQGLALFGSKAKFGVFSRANRTLFILLLLCASIALSKNLAALILYVTIAFAILTVCQRAAFLLGEGR